MNEYLKPDNERFVPVFGDIHGNLEGLVNTVKHLQRRLGRRFDHVLQVGDFGYYPNEFNGSKVSHDLERGVHEYLNNLSVRSKYLNDNEIGFKIIFVRGNHEDQEALAKKTVERPNGLIMLDDNDFLIYAPDGRAFGFNYDQKNTVFVGYGGIDTIPQYDFDFDRAALRNASQFKGIVHFLLTHQGPDNVVKGSPSINELYKAIVPKMSIHGHSHVFGANDPVRRIASFSLGKMPYEKDPFSQKNDFYGFIDLRNMSFIESL